MTILFAALALSAAPAQAAQPATPAPHSMHADHAQHSKPDAKAAGDGCACCKDMAAGGKMACCAKHGEGHGAQHQGHKTNR